MTQWGLDALFNPSKRHMDEEKRRLQTTREQLGDASGGKRIDLESGKVVIRRPARAADDAVEVPADTDDEADATEGDDSAPADEGDDAQADVPDAEAAEAAKTEAEAAEAAKTEAEAAEAARSDAEAAAAAKTEAAADSGVD